MQVSLVILYDFENIYYFQKLEFGEINNQKQFQLYSMLILSVRNLSMNGRQYNSLKKKKVSFKNAWHYKTQKKESCTKLFITYALKY